MDYRDRRPETNARLFMLLVSGCGLRQAGEILELSSGAVQRKFRKLGRQMRCLNRNLLRQIPAGVAIVMDELETFEQHPTSRLTVGVAVEHASKLMLVCDVAPIRRTPEQGSRQRRRFERREARHGRRVDRGKDCVRRVLARLEHLLRGQHATLITDKKPTYGSQCRRRFGPQVRHEAAAPKLPRTAPNPLFAVQLTKRMLREHNGRLDGRSWLVSKSARMLRLQLEIFVAYRNWHRRRHRDDASGLTPAVALGLCPRRLAVAELLAWRQDWGLLSCPPTTDQRSGSREAAGA